MTCSQSNIDELRRLVKYCPETGAIHRLGWVYHGRKFIPYPEPKLVSGTNPLGYVQVRIGGETYLGHRLAWFLVHGEWPEVIDHINGNRADNRLANLRNVTQAENTQNVLRARSHNSTGFLGVSFESDRGKFVAAVGHEGKRHVVGRFNTAEEAHHAYLKRKRELHSASTI